MSPDELSVGHDVRPPKKLVLRHDFGARGLRRFRGQILAPGDDLHAERAADPRDLAADVAETHHPEDSAIQFVAD